MNDVTLVAPAKINLDLSITGRDERSYHYLCSHAGFINLYDEIRLRLYPIGQDAAPPFELSVAYYGEFASSLHDLPPQRSSLFASLSLFYQLYPDSSPFHYHISIKKNIPVGAGLGGGTSDAMALWHYLAKLHAINSPPLFSKPCQVLFNHLMNIGADAPLLYTSLHATLHGNIANDHFPFMVRVEGFGDKVIPILSNTDWMSKVDWLLCYPNQPLSTKDCFDQFRNSGFAFHHPNVHVDQDHMVKAKNDLERSASILCPPLQACLAWLRQQEGVAFARMTGSGSACFSAFTSKKAKEKATYQLTQQNIWVKDIQILHG